MHSGLHEHNRTGVPFLSDEEFERAGGSFFERSDEPVWGKETAEQAGARFQSAVQGVLDELEEEEVPIVAHGTVISLLIAKYNAVDAYALWQSLGLPSFCVLSAEDLQLRETVPNLKT